MFRNLNPFYIAALALMIGAAGHAAWHGNWRLVIISISYAVANGAIAGAK